MQSTIPLTTKGDPDYRQMKMEMVMTPDTVLLAIAGISTDDPMRIDAQLETIPSEIARTIYFEMAKEIETGNVLIRAKIPHYMITFIKLGTKFFPHPDRERAEFAYLEYLETGSINPISTFCRNEASETQQLKNQLAQTTDLDYKEQAEFDIEITTWKTLAGILNSRNNPTEPPPAEPSP